MITDRHDPVLAMLLDSAPTYRKQGQVIARQAEIAEKVVTIIDEKIETKNIAEPGDWIVKNPTGEVYVIKPNKFLSRYEGTDVPGTYRAKGYIRAISNPTKESISFMASWGELQYGEADCIIADTCSISGQRDGEPYIIARDAFEKTYKMC